MFRDSKRSYLMMRYENYSALSFVASVGCFVDDNKVLLRMLQGTATKGVICILLVSYESYAIGDIFERTKEILDMLSELCILPDDKSVPHHCNQGLVFSSGMLWWWSI